MSGSLRLLCKTISYGILHFGVAFAVAYALTQPLLKILRWRWGLA